MGKKQIMGIIYKEGIDQKLKNDGRTGAKIFLLPRK